MSGSWQEEAEKATAQAKLCVITVTKTHACTPVITCVIYTQWDPHWHYGVHALCYDSPSMIYGTRLEHMGNHSNRKCVEWTEITNSIKLILTPTSNKYSCVNLKHGE